MGDPRIGLLLTLADDELILGHRMSEWTGWVPYIEADLAFSSIAQDEIGHARALYDLAVQLGAAGDVDELALGRKPEAYRHASLCSRPNGDFAFSLARHWLYDHADRVRLDALRAGTLPPLRDILAVVELEEAYHLSHADAWFDRLVNGPIAARRRFLEALAALLPLALGVFEPIEYEDSLVADGIMSATSEELLERFLAEIDPLLDAAGIDEVYARTHAEVVPTAAGAFEIEAATARPRTDTHQVEAGGRQGIHDEYFPTLWDEMTLLYRLEPGARW